MGSKFTKNQQDWNNLSKDLLKRIENLKQNNINPNIILPPRPSTITPKQLKKLSSISKELSEMERTFITPISEEIKAKKIQGQSIDNIVKGKRAGRSHGHGNTGGHYKNHEGEKDYSNVNTESGINTANNKGIRNPNSKERSDKGVYRPYIVDSILGRYEERINSGALPQYTRDLLLEYFDCMKEDYGAHQFAQILYEGAKEGIHLTNEILYDSTGQKAITYTMKIAEFMKDKGIYDKNKTLYRGLMEQTLVGDEIYEFYEKIEDYED